jgi:uncharacterized ferredoxin-like protein
MRSKTSLSTKQLERRDQHAKAIIGNTSKNGGPLGLECSASGTIVCEDAPTHSVAPATRRFNTPECRIRVMGIMTTLSVFMLVRRRQATSFRAAMNRVPQTYAPTLRHWRQAPLLA